jgi:hypothetical protein
VNFGVFFSDDDYNTVRYCTIKNFCGDALRPGNNCTMEYNVATDSYDTNGNHDDIIQLYTGSDMTNVVIRGNILMNTTSNHSLMDEDCMGIGGHDGFYRNCVIENNLVAVRQWLGVELLGASNCRIVNNNLIHNPIGTNEDIPFIRIAKKSDGTPSPPNNIIRNNFCSGISSDDDIGSIDHNIITTDYTSHFVDYSGYDFHLKSTSSAINAGSTSGTPTIDLDQYARVPPYDIGCYEYSSDEETSTSSDTATNTDTGSDTDTNGDTVPGCGVNGHR